MKLDEFSIYLKDKIIHDYLNGKISDEAYNKLCEQSEENEKIFGPHRGSNKVIENFKKFLEKEKIEIETSPSLSISIAFNNLKEKINEVKSTIIESLEEFRWIIFSEEELQPQFAVRSSKKEDETKAVLSYKSEEDLIEKIELIWNTAKQIGKGVEISIRFEISDRTSYEIYRSKQKNDKSIVEFNPDLLKNKLSRGSLEKIEIDFFD